MSQIYFIQSGDSIKIGLSSNPAKRIASLSTANPSRLRILGVMTGDRSTERYLHKRFAKFRISGEWFAQNYELVRYIEANCRPLLILSQAKAGPMAPPSVRQQAKNATVAKFLVQHLKREDGGKIPVSGVISDYQSWCEKLGAPIPEKMAVAKEMARLFDKAGLETEVRDGKVYCLDVSASA